MLLNYKDKGDRHIIYLIIMVVLFLTVVALGATYQHKNRERMRVECEQHDGILLQYTQYKQGTAYTCVKQNSLINLKSK